MNVCSCSAWCFKAFADNYDFFSSVCDLKSAVFLPFHLARALMDSAFWDCPGPHCSLFWWTNCWPESPTEQVSSRKRLEKLSCWFHLFQCGIWVHTITNLYTLVLSLVLSLSLSPFQHSFVICPIIPFLFPSEPDDLPPLRRRLRTHTQHTQHTQTDWCLSESMAVVKWQ